MSLRSTSQSAQTQDDNGASALISFFFLAFGVPETEEKRRRNQCVCGLSYRRKAKKWTRPAAVRCAQTARQESSVSIAGLQ